MRCQIGHIYPKSARAACEQEPILGNSGQSGKHQLSPTSSLKTSFGYEGGPPAPAFTAFAALLDTLSTSLCPEDGWRSVVILVVLRLLITKNQTMTELYTSFGRAVRHSVITNNVVSKSNWVSINVHLIVFLQEINLFKAQLKRGEKNEAFEFLVRCQNLVRNNFYQSTRRIGLFCSAFLGQSGLHAENCHRHQKKWRHQKSSGGSKRFLFISIELTNGKKNICDNLSFFSSIKLLHFRFLLWCWWKGSRHRGRHQDGSIVSGGCKSSHTNF